MKIKGVLPIKKAEIKIMREMFKKVFYCSRKKKLYEPLHPRFISTKPRTFIPQQPSLIIHMKKDTQHIFTLLI